MYHVFVDFEMNYFYTSKGSSSEIIQLSAVKCDDNFDIVGEFNTYISCEHAIAKHVTMLTGISARTIAKAPKFSTAIHRLLYWLGNPRNVVVYSWSMSDKSALISQCERYHIRLNTSLKDNWVDAQDIVTKDFILYDKRTLALDKAAELVGIKFIGKAHDAINDARTMRAIIVLKYRNPAKYNKRSPVFNPEERAKQLDKKIIDLQKQYDYQVNKLADLNKQIIALDSEINSLDKRRNSQDFQEAYIKKCRLAGRIDKAKDKIDAISCLIENLNITRILQTA